VAGPANGHEPTNAAGEPLVLLDDPAPGVRRITLNRPEKRNALNNPLRGALITALRGAQLDKRTVHRALDVMGLRAAIRSGTELCSLAIHQAGFQAFIDRARDKGLVAALTERDEPFGDYRTAETH
jgi:hypothetical protein